jgi:4-azaleucine resistance transporter AzlC
VTSDQITSSLKAALPIMAGYVVLGLPCGILCVAAGMDVWMVFVMSLLFYSGAGQYMIPNMWLAANPIASIIASVSLVNTRQLLYGASLSQFCGKTKAALLFWFTGTVTDESFGVTVARFANGNWSVEQALGVNIFSHLTWIASTTLGAALGAAISIPTALASFAMTSLFICLLCMQKLSVENGAAVVGAVLGVIVCKLVGLSGAAILIGALVGIGVALGVGSWREKHGGTGGSTDISIGG